MSVDLRRLVALVKPYREDLSSDGEGVIVNALLFATQSVCRDSGVLINTGTFSSVANQRDYASSAVTFTALPYTIKPLLVKAAWITDPATSKLIRLFEINKPTEGKAIDWNYRNSSSAMPTGFMGSVDGTITLFPKPNAIYTVTVEYSIMPDTEYSNTTISNMPSYAEECIIATALSNLLEYPGVLSDPKLAATWRSRASAKLNTLRAQVSIGVSGQSKMMSSNAGFGMVNAGFGGVSPWPR